MSSVQNENLTGTRGTKIKVIDYLRIIGRSISKLHDKVDYLEMEAEHIEALTENRTELLELEIERLEDAICQQNSIIRDLIEKINELEIQEVE